VVCHGYSSFPPHSNDLEVTLYTNGNGVVKFNWWGVAYIYKDRLTKSVEMGDVN
jgi:hypothetical protein